MREESQGAIPVKYQNFLLVSVILLLVGVSITIVQYKIPSILDLVMAQFAMDSATGAWLMSIFTAMGIFLSLPVGGLTKKLGPKRVLLLGCATIVAGSIVGALAGSAWLMILSRGVEGIAFVFITVAGHLAVEKYVDAEHQGTANGIWSLWICLGSVIGSTATPMVFQSLGLAGTWLAYAVIVVACAVLLAVAVRVPEGLAEAAAEEGGEPVRLADYMQLLRPNALLYLFAYLVFNVEILAVLSYTPTFLQQQGWDASLSGFASSLPGLLAVMAAVVFGRLIDKAGRTKAFYVVAMAAAAPATFLMLTQSGPLLWAGALLMGLVGYGIPVAALTSLPQIAGRKEMVPAMMGLFMMVQGLGEFLGCLVTPMILGPALDQWMLCGAMILALGVLGTAAIAVCRFK